MIKICVELIIHGELLNLEMNAARSRCGVCLGFIGYHSLTRNDAPILVPIQRAQSQLLYGSPNEITG